MSDSFARRIGALAVIAFLLAVACADDDSSPDADDDADDDDDDNNDDNDDDNDDTGPDDDDSTPDEFGLTWVGIPAGAFDMGCSPHDWMCEAEEYPVHHVNISAFQMTETEITQQQYEIVAGEHVNENDGRPFCPVETVTWFEAEDYCEAVGGHLPTEAQWEYAVRAGTTTRYYCGSDADCLDAIAWYYPGSNGVSHPVKKKEPNAFGLYDQLGNVWEWVHDWYGASYYRNSPDTDPVGPDHGQYRILRGGSLYDSDPAYLRVSFRPNDAPEIAYGNIGFRCAREP
jgi:formylglycine-generating enzyme required for sulfatase activity